MTKASKYKQAVMVIEWAIVNIRQHLLIDRRNIHKSVIKKFK